MWYTCVIGQMQDISGYNLRAAGNWLIHFFNTCNSSALILRLLHTVFKIWPRCQHAVNHVCQTPANTYRLTSQSMLHCHFGCFQFRKTCLKRTPTITFNHFRKSQSTDAAVLRCSTSTFCQSKPPYSKPRCYIAWRLCIINTFALLLRLFTTWQFVNILLAALCNQTPLTA